ncbi:MAG: hypothetical protein V3W06_04165 [Acidimicrobiia bacterium]
MSAETAKHDVLVVDDEPMVREVVTRYLERDGLNVRSAADGAELSWSLKTILPTWLCLMSCSRTSTGSMFFRK